jgi:4-hydroxy-3-methylbut-2-en-1-yl diphosphate reductase
MRVICAEAMGMCFGVRDALVAARAVERPVEVTVFGELVHNPLVARELAGRGFSMLGEGERAAANVQTSGILVTAHGVSDRERAGFARAGKEVMDTTCPLVRKAHGAAVALARAGYFVVVAGKRGHVEVCGLVGDLEAGRFDIVETQVGVRKYDAGKIGVMAQTTFAEREFRGIVARVREMNAEAEVKVVDTICQPTRDRQVALERLLGEVDVLVVVGGRASNNTRQLVLRAKEAGVRAIHIEEAGELLEGMFSSGEVVGLTAGTSTLPETIDWVKQRLESFHEHSESRSKKRCDAICDNV